MEFKKADFRVDIQALRGFAVLIVVLYHAGAPLLPAGFLGVDVFFVVSGFLITRIVRRGIERGSFRFAHFYTRRVLRLLPAGYAVLLMTVLIGYYVLTATQYHQFRDQVIGSIFLSANIVLWKQTGYFSMNAAFKPLLHMWSLAIEEQYYLLLPVTLVVVPRRWWKLLILSVTLVSLALCLLVVPTRPSVAFFFLPTRAWELGIGSLATFVAGNAVVRRIAGRALFVALPILLLVPILPLSRPDPGLNALLVCLATMTVILADTRAGDDIVALRGLARIGDFSYSLYLVHWPLFAFARVLYLAHDLPLSVTIMLVLLAFVLAMLLYSFVEEPVRRSALGGWRLVGAVLAASALLAGTVIALERANSLAHVAAAGLKPVVGLTMPGCFSEDVTRFDGTCTQSATPDILVWGDSYSGHVMPGLLATTTRPIAQASKGHCSPFVNYAAVVTANERAFSEGCLAFNRSVLAYLARTPSIGVVVLAGAYPRSFEGQSVAAIRLTDGVIRPAPLGIARTIDAQRETTAAIRGLGKRVIVISPPPQADLDLGQCWERMAEHLTILGKFAGCTLDLQRTAVRQGDLNAMLNGFEMRADTPVVRMNHALCRKTQCQTQTGSWPIFLDGEHLSTAGSMLMATRLQLGDTVWAQAR